MDKYDIIQLTKSDNELKNKNIHQDCYGIIIDKQKGYYTILFLNDKNYGDFAITKVNELYCKKVGKLEKQQIIDIENFLKNQEHKEQFFVNNQAFNEYDCVELLVDREKYNKQDVFKGDIGCVISKYGIFNTIEVDFSWVDSQNNCHGGIIVVSTNDIKKIDKE
ncbi:MAG: hypothetical protein IJU58_00655 [Clostridia bacterium]|nr:hypothetical protein [Clostridia bacterium]